MSPPHERGGGPGHQPGTAAHTLAEPATKRFDSAQDSATHRLPVVFSVQVFTANTGKLMNTVAVEHDECQQTHLHRTRSLAPFIRRALCGRGTYRVVPVLAAAVPYGADYPDTQDWADRDGAVYRGEQAWRAAS